VSLPDIVVLSDLLLLVVGCAFGLWWIFSGRSRRWLDSPDLLPAWDVNARDFLSFAAIALLAFVIVPVITAQVLHLGFKTAAAPVNLLAPSYAAQFALIVPCLVFRYMPAGKHTESSVPFARVLLTACAALLLVLPLLQGLILGWEWLLENLGVSAPHQPVIDLLRNAGRPFELSLWIVLAVVAAPVSEELFFRAGVFRFLGTLMPAWAAALISSVMWTLLHDNLLSSLPLVVLGMILAMLYRKTGRILAPILLHALFNLHTVIAALLGPPA
jgi:membrane protease YdiL (CAAX protease family)